MLKRASQQLELPVVWIAVKDLTVVWEDAQQPFNPRRAKAIADEFDPDLFGIVTVAKAGSVYHIVDGQHRVRAVLDYLGWDEQRIPCIVLADATEQAAAERFLEINGFTQRRSPTALTSFKVGVTAGRTEQVQINKIVETFGYKIGTRSSKSPRVISAVNVLRHILKYSGAAGLHRVLLTVDSTWHGADPDAIHGQILSGYFSLFQKFPDADDERLVRQVAKSDTAGHILALAKGLKDAYRSKSTGIVVMEVLVGIYNKGLRSGALL